MSFCRIFIELKPRSSDKRCSFYYNNPKYKLVSKTLLYSHASSLFAYTRKPCIQ